MSLWDRLRCWIGLHDVEMKHDPGTPGSGFWDICRRCRRYFG